MAWNGLIRSGWACSRRLLQMPDEASRCLVVSSRSVNRSSNVRDSPASLDVPVSPFFPKMVVKQPQTLRQRIGAAMEQPNLEDLIHDFSYSLTLNPQPTDARFQVLPQDQRPLVLLLGWAGATPKNLEKYAQIYHKAGCSTLGYNLPSRFVFTDTSEVPCVARELLGAIEEAGLMDKPLFVHAMSDTGLMAFQGMNITCKLTNQRLNIAGMVLDSCPGPRPKGTLQRIMAYSIVHWICCRKGGLSLSESVAQSIRFAKIRGIPSILRYLNGLQVELSMMNDTWAGDFYRDLSDAKWPELFLYSKTDYYLPWEYLEKHVLESRIKAGRDVSLQCWDKSPHVSHLKAHPQQYENAVLTFLYEKYFRQAAAKLK